MRLLKAARIRSYCGKDILRMEETSLGEPGAGEVLVRIHTAGVNPVDSKIRPGHLQQPVPLRLPVTLGSDFSGVVEAMGRAVEGFNVGDQVYGSAGVLTGGSESFAQAAIHRAPRWQPNRMKQFGVNGESDDSACASMLVKLP